MAAVGWSLALATIFLSLWAAYGEQSAAEEGKPCPYFGGTRVSSRQGNLVNCSWYADNACCKRTEVTSVFGGMFPLYGATQDCEHHMNYMMCYFCSPQQYIWYNKRVTVCADFCNEIYEHCHSARYEGVAIGDEYANGFDFCRGQRFIVVNDKHSCFDYDPLVFGRGTRIYSPLALSCITCLMFLITCLT